MIVSKTEKKKEDIKNNIKTSSKPIQVETKQKDKVIMKDKMSEYEQLEKDIIDEIVTYISKNDPPTPVKIKDESIPYSEVKKSRKEYSEKKKKWLNGLGYNMTPLLKRAQARKKKLDKLDKSTVGYE